MIRCGNWRDKRWIATQSHLSASWTPNQLKRPNQAESAATMGVRKVNGRKRQFWVDTNGFFPRVRVLPADISDTEGAECLLAARHQSFPRMHEIRVDEGYKQGLNEWMQKNTTIRLNVIEKPPGQKGCAVIPK